MATQTAPASNGSMAWISSKRELVAAKITKIRAKLPLPADVAVATAGGCVQVRGNEKEEKMDCLVATRRSGGGGGCG